MSDKITKVDILTTQSKLEELMEELNKVGISGMTVSNVMGCGVQKGHKEFYRGTEVEVKLLPKIKIEIVICSVPVEDVINTVKRVLYTGKIGDGKIFVYDVANVIRISDNAEGKDAL